MHCIKSKSLRWTALLCALLAGATLASYWPVFHNDFLRFDDAKYVADNPHVISGLKWENVKWALTANACSNWHPMTWWSHMLDVELFRMRPGWHHLTSLLFHITNTVLLLLLLKRMTGALWRSALVAALFALHPLHVESVAWVAERKDVLSTFFFLLTLLAYVRYTDRTDKTDRPHKLSWWWYGAALVLFAFGLMSKPMLVTVPFVLLLLDFWPLGRVQTSKFKVQSPEIQSPKSKVQSPTHEARATEYGTRNTQHATRGPLGLVLEKIPFLALSVASSVITFLVQKNGHAVSTADGLPLEPRLTTSVVAYVKYLGKMLWPTRLAVFYPHPGVRGPAGQYPEWMLAGAALLLVVVSVVALRHLKRAPWLATGWFWYLGTLVPVIGIVQVGGQEMADRYTYIPLIGIFIAVVWELADLRFSIFDIRLQPNEGAEQSIPEARLPVGRAIAAVAVLLACALVTHRQVHFWKDNFTLFKHTLAVTSEDNAPALYYNGVGLEDEANAAAAQGKLEEAKTKMEAAEEKFKEAVQKDPSISDAFYCLGVIYGRRGQAEEAIAEYRAALDVQPWNAQSHNGLGAMYWQQGKNEQARAEYEKALDCDPELPEAHFNLGTLLFAQGDLPGAELHYAEAVRRRPGNTDTLRRLATVRVRQGKLREAEADLRELVRIGEERAAQTPNVPHPAMLRSGAASQTPKKPEDRAGRTSDVEQTAVIRATKDEIDGSLASLHYNLGDVLRLESKMAEAASEFAEAARVKPDYALAVTALGRMLAAQGDLSGAEGRFRDAVRFQPTDAEAHLTLGGLLMVSGKTNEAAASFAKARQLDPQLAARNLEEGRALVQKGDFASARLRFVASLSLEPLNPSPHAQLGHLLLGQGDLNGALAQVREALRLLDCSTCTNSARPGSTSEILPDLLPALNDLAWLLATAPQAQLRNGTQAVALAERACKLSGGKQARFWGTLDAAYAEAARWDDAITTAEKTRTLALTAGETNLCALASQRLELYRAHQPFRQ